MIGICGGSASGKTTVANKIISELGKITKQLLIKRFFFKLACCLFWLGPGWQPESESKTN